MGTFGDIKEDDSGSPLKKFAEVIGRIPVLDTAGHALLAMKRQHVPRPWRPAFWVHSLDFDPSFLGKF